MPIRAVLLAVVLAITAAAPAQAELKAIWGANTLRGGGSAFPVYKDLGVDVLQEQLVWNQVARSRPAHPREPSDPAYVWPRTLDFAYRAAFENHIKIALLVRGTPAWANGGKTSNWAPDNLGDYADFLVAAARRYKRVRLWMIWGEPSRAAQFSPLPPNSPEGPRLYARLLDRAYGVLKKVRRKNKVIGGMTFHAGDIVARDFMRWMRLPNGKPPRLDWFGHNPFTARRPDLRKPTYFPGLRDMSDLDTYIKEIRRHWKPRHIKPKLWLSEFCVASDRPNSDFAFHVTREAQADWLTQAFKIAHSHRWIAGFGWWNLQDAAADDGITCGLLDRDGVPKPSYLAYKLAR